MPELPEVHTTVVGLQKHVVGFSIEDVWTDYKSFDKRFAEQIKNPKYFSWFRKTIRGAKILSSERRAKNILIGLSNGWTILIHMKMTGHLLFGNYKKVGHKWRPDEHSESPLHDPFNRFIHLVFTLLKKKKDFSIKKHLVLSDMRKFAKISLIESRILEEKADLKKLGPEPLTPFFTFKVFLEQIGKTSNKAIKTALLNQEIISGIGNIYSDEILWRASVHPFSVVKKIPKKDLLKVFKNIKPLLTAGINFRGDSMSDYRNLDGRPGEFQNHHEVYRRTGKKCSRRGCGGKIERAVVGGRSAHFCPKHQKLHI